MVKALLEEVAAPRPSASGHGTASVAFDTAGLERTKWGSSSDNLCISASGRRAFLTHTSRAESSMEQGLTETTKEAELRPTSVDEATEHACQKHGVWKSS